jgi:hypothetical protein
MGMATAARPCPTRVSAGNRPMCLFLVALAQVAAAAKEDDGKAGGPPQPLPPPDKLQAFTCGLLAGLVAKLVSHPLDVAKKRYQVGPGPGIATRGPQRRAGASAPLLASPPPGQTACPHAGAWAAPSPKPPAPLSPACARARGRPPGRRPAALAALRRARRGAPGGAAAAVVPR